MTVSKEPWEVYCNNRTGLGYTGTTNARKLDRTIKQKGRGSSVTH